jgi:O-antigen/teichoic acid export membrane protein
MRMSSFLVVPIFFGTAAVAAEFIELIFGEKWQASGVLMGLLAIGSAPVMIRLQINAAINAQGKPQWVMLSNLTMLCLALVIGYFTIPLGLNYAASAYITINYMMCLISILLFCRVFECRLLTIFHMLWPSYLSSGLMLVVCLLVREKLPAEWPSTLKIIAICTTGGMVYLLLSLLVFRRETKNFLHEGLSIAPAKFSPLLIRLQGWLRLH